MMKNQVYEKESGIHGFVTDFQRNMPVPVMVHKKHAVKESVEQMTKITMSNRKSAKLFINTKSSAS